VDSCRGLLFTQEQEPLSVFRFEPEQEPESTLRSLQKAIKIFKEPIEISVMMLVVEQNGIN